MLRLALDGQSGLVIDTQELRREGPSYTVDTLRAIRAEIGPQTPLCLLLGSDAFNSLDQWRQWRELIELAHLVVADRAGFESSSNEKLSRFQTLHQAESENQLRQCPAGMILHCRFTALDISASSIRAERQAGNSLQYLLPTPVIEYIEETGLYCGAVTKQGSNH